MPESTILRKRTSYFFTNQYIWMCGAVMRHLQVLFVFSCLIGLVTLSACGESASTAGRVPQGDTGPQLATALTVSPTPGVGSLHSEAAFPGASSGTGGSMYVGAL